MAVASSAPAAAAASSGSNGSPATAAPRSTRRVSSDRSPSSSASEAITAAGTPTASSAAPASGRPRAGAVGAGELLEVERVAARLLVELVRPLASDGVAEQLAGRLAGEAAQLEPGEAALAVGALEGRREAIGRSDAGVRPSRRARPRRAGCAGAR